MNIYFPYLRGSTDRQRNTIEAQQIGLRQHWEREYQHTLAWGEFYADPATTSRVPLTERPAGKLLLARVQSGDHIAVTRLDRAFRSVKEACAMMDQWEKQGIVVDILDMPYLRWGHWMGKAILQIMAVFAEMERGIISERTKDGMSVEAVKAKLKGRKGPHAGLGWRYQGQKKVAHEGERVVMAMIVQLRDEKGLSFEQIAQEILAAKLATKSGGVWHAKTCWKAYGRAKALARAEGNGHAAPVGEGG